MPNRTTAFTALFCLLALSSFSQSLDMDLLKALKPRNIGPAGMSGRITAIEGLNSNPDLLYVGAAAGGLWRSENGGYSWTPIFEHEKAASIGAIALNQHNPDEIWVGTGEGNPRNSLNSGYGVYRTLDRGRSWTYMGLGETHNIHRIIMHPDDPKTLWVAAIGSPWSEQEARGVYKTTDGGKTWKKTLFVDVKTGCADLVIDPANPNKLIAAMWEHRRWPWFFKSGGPGSGLYMSVDGGETWQKRTDADGLPKGDLGRIGLAIAPGKTDIVYALVEAKKNGLYKSEDGGWSWSLVSEKNIGGRPFYYADIYVDPKNENRLFNIHTNADISQDGGKSFSRFVPGNLIHGDYHAFWIHPDNPNLIMLGNDGGMCITRDGGKTWYFPENLALGQYYHVNVDMDVPYNVYGGLQDNGTWVGPSQVWRNKGITNMYWDRVAAGDGFDAAPDPSDSRFGYGMSQQGGLVRFDRATGTRYGIKPYLASGDPLRFNWNAALAIDPIDKKTIYYGSQYLLRSTDKGMTWQAVSPDLTTNNPEKQKQNESGGLTLDATGAENHCTILTIAPSPKQQGVIWVGTDDGNIQLTRNGGQTWELLNTRIKGLPKTAWIPQIQASPHNPAEAFVVVNNYRLDDWAPYLFHTKDYGQTWTRLADDKQVWGYVLSVLQDPVAPNLLFLGSEYGLYISMDYGKTWTKWTNGYPTLPTMDMVIHPRENDLVIGTFGRSVWILDDIRPLREMAQKGLQTTLDKPLRLFEPPLAWLADEGEMNGYRSTGNGMFSGENREIGALLTFYLKEPKEGQKATLKVFDQAGQLIRTLSVKAEKGMNRMTWGLDRAGIHFPTQPKPKPDGGEPGGRRTLPGTYKVKLSYGEWQDSAMVEVKLDPLQTITTDQMKTKAALLDRLQAAVAKVTPRVWDLKEAKEIAQSVVKTAKANGSDGKRLAEQGETVIKGIDALLATILEPEDVQGIYNDDNLLTAILGKTRYGMGDLFSPPSPTQEILLSDCEKAVNEAMEKINHFFLRDWADLKKESDGSGMSWVKWF